MKKQLQQVKEFYESFGDGNKIGQLNLQSTDAKERFDLRKRLQQEELDETFAAVINEDLTEIIDGLGDQLYILFGTILELGLEDKIEDIFSDIHASNMSKLCTSQSEAEQTVRHYNDKGVMVIWQKIKNRLYVVKRAKDDKILKNINYKPVDLTKYTN